MRVTRDRIRKIIREELFREAGFMGVLSQDEVHTLIDAGFNVDGINADNLTPDMKRALAAVDSVDAAADGVDNDGDGEIDEPDEGAYFSQGGTVSEFISYLQTLDGSLPVECAIAEGPYLMALASCSFAVIQPGEGTDEVRIDDPTFMILCEP